MQIPKYRKETKTVPFQGRQIVIENLAPMLPQKVREERKKEIEKQLFDVFVKYQGKQR